MLVYVRKAGKTQGCEKTRQAKRLWGLAGAGLCLAAALGAAPLRPGLVVGHSMEPTLPHGTFFVYDRSYYRNRLICPGDVVVLRHGDEIWIKRVYAAERTRFWTLRSGGTESVRHDPIRPAQESYFTRAAARLRAVHGVDYRMVRLRVRPGFVFLVGDGATSEDSRVFGPVGTEEVLGRVIALPGQRLGSVPEWVELSSPAGRRAAKRAAKPPAVSPRVAES